MSFRLFIYYCAVCGGWAAFLGWIVGRRFAPAGDDMAFARTVFQGFVLGSTVALALGLLDAFWNHPVSQFVQILLRAGVALLVSALGSYAGAALGQLLYSKTQQAALVVVGWTAIGLLIGVSVGAYDVLAHLARGESIAAARRKAVHGLLGGALGGLLGSTLYLLLGADWGVAQFFKKPSEQIRISSALGFVALGLSIGLFIGLAQIMLKEAWITVEAGFKAGREMILAKAETVIGRAEGCDIGLFGDQAVERTHAKILLRENRYYLADAGSTSGTFLNDQKIAQPTLLRAGDRIRLGNCVLRFGERQKNT